MIQTYASDKHTSEALPALFTSILELYIPQRLFFARGPGSFMAIKISYIFLKTFGISLDIPFLACDGFVFNENAPIKAMRNLYFVKENDAIKTVRFEKAVDQKFSLPKRLDPSLFSDLVEPLYMLPAV